MSAYEARLEAMDSLVEEAVEACPWHRDGNPVSEEVTSGS